MRLPPPGNRTIAVAESGLMAATGCVLFLCWYNPVLYMLAITLTPMPLTLLAYRYGGATGMAGLGCTSAAVAAFVGPVEALTYVGLFGVVGLITGWLIHRGVEPNRLLLGGSGLLFCCNIAGYYGLERLLGMEDSLAPVRDGLAGGLAELGARGPSEFIPLVQGLGKSIADFFAFPAALIFAVSFMAFVTNYSISVFVMGRLGITVRLPPGLLFFRLPARLGAAGAAVLLAATLLEPPGWLPLRVAEFNLVVLVAGAFSVEALSAYLCCINMTRLGLAGRLASMAVFFALFPFWWLFGIADCFFDLRSLAVLLLM